MSLALVFVRVRVESGLSRPVCVMVDGGGKKKRIIPSPSIFSNVEPRPQSKSIYRVSHAEFDFHGLEALRQYSGHVMNDLLFL